MIEALKYHLLKGEQKSLFKTPRTKPRQPRGLPKVLLVVGGQAPKAIRSVECYDFKEERWYQVSELPTRRCRAGKKYLRSSNLSTLTISLFSLMYSHFYNLLHTFNIQVCLSLAVVYTLLVDLMDLSECEQSTFTMQLQISGHLAQKWKQGDQHSV